VNTARERAELKPAEKLERVREQDRQDSVHPEATVREVRGCNADVVLESRA